MQTIKGKAAFVTGSATGIGSAIVLELATKGATTIILADVDIERAEETAKLAQEVGAKTLVVRCDVTEEDSVVSAVATGWEFAGAIDITFANAGVGWAAPLLETDSQSLDWVMAVNLFGVLNTARAYINKARHSEHPGHLMITGSEHSVSLPHFLRTFGLGAYNMTKHAIRSIAETLRYELANDNIEVSLLMPGPVHTEVAASARNRQERFGGTDQRTDFDPQITPGEHIPPYISAQQAANIALQGIEKSLFYVPTHRHILEYAVARQTELEAAFTEINFD